MKRLVVIGGGIAGLAAARAASDLGGQVAGGLEVVLLEREREVGGKALSLQSGEWLVEAGPHAYQPGEPALERLIAAAGMGSERIDADPAAARRYVVAGSRAREIRPHPLALARSGILGPLGFARAALEPLVPVRRSGPEESVRDFAARRFGRAVAERLAAAACLGIYAGDAGELSIAAAFPSVHELEIRHGGVLRGLAAQRRKRAPNSQAGARLASFRGGMQALPLALARGAPFAIRRGAAVLGLARDRTGWRIAVAGAPEALAADAVVLAGEAWSMAALAREPLPELAAELAAIPYAPVAVVALGFDARAAARVPPGYGVLAPRGQGLRLLGCLFETQVFERRGPAGALLVRCLYGGRVDPAAAALDEGELVQLARAETSKLLGLDAPPIETRVHRWPRAIPQYALGHLARADRIRQAVERGYGLFLAGNYVDGVAFGRAAASGLAAGEAAARFLAQR